MTSTSTGPAPHPQSPAQAAPPSQYVGSAAKCKSASKRLASLGEGGRSHGARGGCLWYVALPARLLGRGGAARSSASPRARARARWGAPRGAAAAARGSRAAAGRGEKKEKKKTNFWRGAARREGRDEQRPSGTAVRGAETPHEQAAGGARGRRCGAQRRARRAGLRGPTAGRERPAGLGAEAAVGKGLRGWLASAPAKLDGARGRAGRAAGPTWQARREAEAAEARERGGGGAGPASRARAGAWDWGKEGRPQGGAFLRVLN